MTPSRREAIKNKNYITQRYRGNDITYTNIEAKGEGDTKRKKRKWDMMDASFRACTGL
jgi:hypothetical protein